ncbi:MAG: hypothetical protein GY754_19355 [bacterium]|nr:hypothetical protein [bacterium]
MKRSGNWKKKIKASGDAEQLSIFKGNRQTACPRHDVRPDLPKIRYNQDFLILYYQIVMRKGQVETKRLRKMRKCGKHNTVSVDRKLSTKPRSHAERHCH